jgi:hypothetical protein
VQWALEAILFVTRVEEHMFICISSVSADTSQRNLGKEGNWTFAFNKALPGVCVSQP